METLKDNTQTHDVDTDPMPIKMAIRESRLGDAPRNIQGLSRFLRTVQNLAETRVLSQTATAMKSAIPPPLRGLFPRIMVEAGLRIRGQAPELGTGTGTAVTTYTDTSTSDEGSGSESGDSFYVTPRSSPRDSTADTSAVCVGICRIMY